MFVLCPHCHFLVGVDPRTGKPPAHCPKCGGVVIEPVPEPSEDAAPPTATPLDPFAQIGLPSLAQTALPLSEPEAASETAPGPEAAPMPAAPTPAKPARKPRAWFQRKDEPVAETAPTPIAEAPPQPGPEPTTHRADAMIAALISRKTTPKRKAASPPPPPPVEHATIVEPVEVEVDALPPAVLVEDVVAAPFEASIDAGSEEVAESAADIAIVWTVVEAPAEVVVDAITDVAPSAATAEIATETAMIETTAEVAASSIIETPVQTRSRVIADDDEGPDAPDAFTAAVAEILPPTPTPMRRRSDSAAPSFHRRERMPIGTRTNLRAIAVVSALVLLLTLQLLLAQRNELAATPRWRPLVGALCGMLRCSLPPWREPAAFTMLSRDVRPHPGAPGTLLINASFRNDARWPQPWPSLQLTLSDLDGRMVGARAFAAREYLGAAPTQNELAPGQSAAITLAVVEPAPNVVAFTFDFR